MKLKPPTYSTDNEFPFVFSQYTAHTEKPIPIQIKPAFKCINTVFRVKREDKLISLSLPESQQFLRRIISISLFSSFSPPPPPGAKNFPFERSADLWKLLE